MTLDLRLGDDHDLALDALGHVSLVGDAGRVRQQIKITLMTLLGEWFLDTGFGVPYFEDVLVKNPNRATIEAVLRARILDVPDVTRVGRLVLEVDRALRTLQVKFEAETAAGVVEDVVALQAS